MCSLSNSARVRTSITSTLKLLLFFHSYSVRGNNDVNGNSGFSAGTCGDTEGIRGDADRGRAAAFDGLEDSDIACSESPDGFRGTVGDIGWRAGDAGRLTNASMVGGMGVLDGRGAWSIGRTGNVFANALGVVANPFISISSSAPDALLAREVELPAVAPMGIISSSSSMEGKLCVKSEKFRWDMRGEEDAEEVGEGGPKLEAGTSAWGEDIVELAVIGVARTVGLSGVGGDSRVRFWRDIRFAFGRTGSGDMGVGISRDNRLVVETARPASCNNRMRSAMLPPDVRIGPSASSSARAFLCDC